MTKEQKISLNRSFICSKKLYFKIFFATYSMTDSIEWLIYGLYY